MLNAGGMVEWLHRIRVHRASIKGEVAKDCKKGGIVPVLFENDILWCAAIPGRYISVLSIANKV